MISNDPNKNYKMSANLWSLLEKSPTTLPSGLKSQIWVERWSVCLGFTVLQLEQECLAFSLVVSRLDFGRQLYSSDIIIISFSTWLGDGLFWLFSCEQNVHWSFLLLLTSWLVLHVGAQTPRSINKEVVFVVTKFVVKSVASQVFLEQYSFTTLVKIDLCSKFVMN